MRIDSISIGVVTVLGTVVGAVAAVVFVITLIAIEKAPQIATQAAGAAQSKVTAIRSDVARRLNITEAKK
jgi:hypothetical protein